MPEQIKYRVPATNLDRQSEQELTALLNALVDGIRAVTAVLDADAGVTATTLTATFDAIISK
jgi:hypothetical protein